MLLYYIIIMKLPEYKMFVAAFNYVLAINIYIMD